jgi:hypothetical protein
MIACDPDDGDDDDDDDDAVCYQGGSDGSYSSGGGGGFAYTTTTTITFPSVCTSGQVLTASGQCVDPDTAYVQQVVNQVASYLNSFGVGGFGYAGATVLQQGELEGGILAVGSCDTSNGCSVSSLPEASFGLNSVGPYVTNVAVGNEYSSSSTDSLVFVGVNTVNPETGGSSPEAGVLFSLTSGTFGFYFGTNNLGGGLYFTLGGTTLTPPSSSSPSSEASGSSAGCSVLSIFCGGGH